MYEFDKIDVKIVNLLLDDGRMPPQRLRAAWGIFQSGLFVIALTEW
jgi:DNA-binding Lrp family transcriptional regulator